MKPDVDVSELIDWIYSYHIKSADGTNPNCCGFRGSMDSGLRTGGMSKDAPYDFSHVTMVYAALCTLITLGDDLSRLDKQGTVAGIVALQCPDEPGLFQAGLFCPERDMRFVFSAVASCYILDSLSSLDTEAIVGFIGRSLTHDGGFAQLPGLEAHAGATYCALASLACLNRLESFLPASSRARERLVKWLLSLQDKGFHGRPHKPDDTCYTYWVCASLKLLGCEKFVDQDRLLQFVSSAWDECVGGIRKIPDPSYPSDPLHTFLCLSGLACLKPSESATSDLSLEDLRATLHESVAGAIGDDDKQDSEERVELFRSLLANVMHQIHPELNVTEPTFRRIQELHRKWRGIDATKRES
ncbi:unnamed protein product [Calicophoron daubneyi]